MQSPNLSSLGLLSSVLLVSTTQAAEPAWFADIFEPGATESNYSPALLGQAKNITDHAYTEFSTRFGSAMPVSTPSFTVSAPENYSPLNIGQLKALSAPLYDTLESLIPRYTDTLFVSNGLPGATSHYPWNPDTPVEENYTPANIGQLKLVFSFDFDIDTDTDSLPDWWELLHFGHLSQSGSDNFDSSGDADSNLTEYTNGTNPAGGTATDIDADGKTDSTEPLVAAPGMTVGIRDHVSVGLSVSAR